MPTSDSAHFYLDRGLLHWSIFYIFFLDFPWFDSVFKQLKKGELLNLTVYSLPRKQSKYILMMGGGDHALWRKII